MTILESKMIILETKIIISNNKIRKNDNDNDKKCDVVEHKSLETFIRRFVH